MKNLTEIKANQDWINFVEETDVIKKFNLFIKHYCKDSYSHLIDTDDNAGEFMRQAIRDATDKAPMIGTICGKPIDEVVNIIQMLDEERLAEMNFTVANIEKWVKLYYKKMTDNIQEQISSIVKDMAKEQVQEYPPVAIDVNADRTIRFIKTCPNTFHNHTMSCYKFC